MKLWSVPVAIVALMSSACSENLRLKVAAEALSKAADDCLYDVRDRSVTYEQSPNCAALGQHAQSYIEAGGFRDEPSEIALIAEKARAVAWMARATSLPGGRGLRIW